MWLSQNPSRSQHPLSSCGGVRAHPDPNIQLVHVVESEPIQIPTSISSCGGVRAHPDPNIQLVHVVESEPIQIPTST
ncbi:hypothetical protein RRG08_000481 [Elysia crispata]|uniref:Uncharacterized protein n=1 Tax=Elysia crispata TaxID=231223 RepID=A0AAE0YCL9_9GAST|nr:hypothetical protein RRG08_000481 [Elysia crispata]